MLEESLRRLVNHPRAAIARRARMTLSSLEDLKRRLDDYNTEDIMLAQRDALQDELNELNQRLGLRTHNRYAPDVNAQVRAWARKQGLEVNHSGRISKEIREAWEKRNNVQ